MKYAILVICCVIMCFVAFCKGRDFGHEHCEPSRDYVCQATEGIENTSLRRCPECGHISSECTVGDCAYKDIVTKE